MLTLMLKTLFLEGCMTSVTGLNNNEYQIARGQVLNRNTRLDKTCNFVKDAHQWVPLGEVGAHEMPVAAREGCRQLQAMSPQDRSKILLSIADALGENERLIAIENEADVAVAYLAGYEQSLIARLTLKPEKISSLANSIRVLANMEEPIGRVLKKTKVLKWNFEDLIYSDFGYFDKGK
ncbi:delta-1-pyrroline-5-carboxylate synthase-like, partial [Camellia sinensis]|uniref:delta-1-pyrroline-5-carboxylate synthase-like n=1 Tax=Camellia sinensis TaxID=4442 RepID=UPI00103635FA